MQALYHYKSFVSLYIKIPCTYSVCIKFLPLPKQHPFISEQIIIINIILKSSVKEKEQHKQDILNLKARISSCCGGEGAARAEGGQDAAAAKLLRQVDDLEQRLVDTRALLDEAVHERDTYKAKVILSFTEAFSVLLCSFSMRKAYTQFSFVVMCDQ